MRARLKLVWKCWLVIQTVKDDLVGTVPLLYNVNVLLILLYISNNTNLVGTVPLLYNANVLLIILYISNNTSRRVTPNCDLYHTLSPYNYFWLFVVQFAEQEINSPTTCVICDFALAKSCEAISIKHFVPCIKRCGGRIQWQPWRFPLYRNRLALSHP